MSVRTPVFDNPIDRSKMPNRSPPFEFPATTYVPSRDHIQSLFSVLFVIFALAAACVFASYYLLGSNIAVHSAIRSASGVGLFLLVAAVAMRPVLQARGFSNAIAILCLVETTLALSDPGSLRLLPTIAVLSLAWASLDIAVHWTYINPFEGKPSLLDPRYVIVATAVACLSWSIRTYVLEPHSFMMALLLSAIAFGIAVALNFESGYRFYRLLVYGTINFIAYPDNHSLAPGLIASPSSHSTLRLLPIATYFVAFSFSWLTIGSQPQPLEVLQALTAALMLAMGVLSMVLIATAMPVRSSNGATEWNEAVNANISSKVPVHKNSIYLGKVAADGSPVQIDRSLLSQHAHFLGKTGSGKTSLGLVPMMEQLIRAGDASVIVIDLKGDTLELLAAMDSARQETKNRRKKDLPLQVFSMKNGVRTVAFNPFLTKGWKNLSILERTDIICSALGIDYGTEYGKAFFSACHAALIAIANQENLDAMSFRQLLEQVERILFSKENDRILPEIRKNAAHAWFTLKRMAAFDAINVTAPTNESPDVLKHQIELSDFFVRPQLAYFQLPSTIAASSAPAIGRLVAQFLLIAGNQCSRSNKIYLVIDEFQRMASDSLNQLFQMARSLDIGLILANQSMSDLKAINSSLASSVESNCHVRQWFSVGDHAELKMLEEMFGTREELKFSHTSTKDGTSVTSHWEDVQRASTSDLQTISSDPHLSIMSITGDRKGYGQYRGVPFVVRSEFHITTKEYEGRKKYQWPTDLPGMMTGGTTFSKRNTSHDPAERDFSDDRDQEPPTWQSEMFE